MAAANTSTGVSESESGVLLLFGMARIKPDYITDQGTVQRIDEKKLKKTTSEMIGALNNRIAIINNLERKYSKVLTIGDGNPGISMLNSDGNKSVSYEDAHTVDIKVDWHDTEKLIYEIRKILTKLKGEVKVKDIAFGSNSANFWFTGEIWESKAGVKDVEEMKKQLEGLYLLMEDDGRIFIDIFNTSAGGPILEVRSSIEFGNRLSELITNFEESGFILDFSYGRDYTRTHLKKPADCDRIYYIPIHNLCKSQTYEKFDKFFPKRTIEFGYTNYLNPLLREELMLNEKKDTYGTLVFTKRSPQPPTSGGNIKKRKSKRKNILKKNIKKRCTKKKYKKSIKHKLNIK